MELRHRALQVLCLTDPEHKAAETLALHAAAASCAVEPHATLPPAPEGLPGRPQRPELLHHTAVARRSPATPLGRAVLLHAIAHIEFNAINPSLDAVWRFSGLHAQY